MSKKNTPPEHKADPFLEREAQNYETPIPSREYILSVLTELGEPTKRKALIAHFALTDPDLQEGLRRRLKAMVRDGQLFKSPEGYVPLTNAQTIVGDIVIEKEGMGHIQSEEGQTILLGGLTLKGFYDGDKVEVQVTQIGKDGFAKGRITKLIQATTPLVIGRLIKTRDVVEVLPFDRKFSHHITIPKEHKNQAKDGDIVQIEILREEKYQYHSEPVAKVIEVLGDFSTPGIEVKMAIRKFGIPEFWSKALEKEAKQYDERDIKSTDERTDLTALPLVTIDGEDAKDFDDAVYCEPKKEGGWQLWVAIADVSYYVKPNSALDREAKLRGNSTYFPGSVVPMLPEVLSNGLCSLKPNVPRLCMVCQMSISPMGEITRSTFYRAVMHSKARLTYTEVSEIVRGNEVVHEKHATLVKPLLALHDLYQALVKQRKERGAIDFDTIETRILFDVSGKIKSIVPQVRNVAHKMIEESMLAANVCAAKFLQKHKKATLFRIHDRPPAEKLKSLRQFLSELGLDLPGQQKPTAKDFCTLIQQIQHREDKHMIETVMLRSLSQAQYSPKNIGHFGLAYPSYVHFTSPIRRYPDLIVHRGIVEILENKGKKKADDLDYENLGLQCSETERRSDDATRDAALALKCHFMLEKIGQEFKGVVSGVASFGVFVELKDIYVEGLIHVTQLGNEYFHYDAIHHRMIGDRTRTVFRLGDSVEVRVVRVDVETKRIDLELRHMPVHQKESKKQQKKQHKKAEKTNRSQPKERKKGKKKHKSRKARKKK